jgi:peroxiredoxin
MKKIILSSLALLVLFFTDCTDKEPDTKELLTKINDAVKAMKDGQYVFRDQYKKVAVGEDSTESVSEYQCFFKQVPSDSLVGYYLNSKRNDGYQRVYNGSALMTVIPFNGSLEVMDAKTHPRNVQEVKGDYQTFPFFKYLNHHIQYYNKDTLRQRLIITKEIFHGMECYKLELYYKPGKTKNKTESFVFVSIESLLPIGEMVRFTKFIGDAKEVQTFDHWMDSLKTTTPEPDKFEKATLTGFNKEFEFNPNQVKSTSLLPVGVMAPDWKLPQLSGTELRLKDLKGKIVVMDFWYKACAPCQKQMIDLQSLHEKFDKNKVVFVGVNTKDDPEKDKLELFLQKRKITINTVYKGKSIEPLYNVYSSPALFVIDQQGKIILAIDGYSDSLLNDVAQVIEKNL